MNFRYINQWKPLRSEKSLNRGGEWNELDQNYFSIEDWKEQSKTLSRPNESDAEEMVNSKVVLSEA